MPDGIRTRWFVGGAAVVVCAAVLLVMGFAEGGPGSAARPAPPLSGRDLEGRHHDLRELRGSVVLVTAWASWCEPCREEVPVLSAALARYGDDGLEVLGMNVQDRRAKALAFVAAERPGFASVVDHEGNAAVDWGLRGVPETFVVDRDGRLVAHRFGAVTQEWVADVVVPVLAP